MNKQFYRLIFNESRRCLMPVAETACAQGKSGEGQRVHRICPGCCRRPAPLRAVALASQLACRAMFLTLAVVWGLTSPASAQSVVTRIVADPSATKAQQATVLNASNGVVQVNIQTPSGAGVSRNIYSQFDVGGKGAILNNSRTDVSTQLGGWVQGNPWLATGAARVILNEVNASNPSQLQGMVEVAGQRAEVIVANPTGIAVNGAGFINASGVTLTTGAPVMNAGSLESFRVQRGTVFVSGQGLDVSGADYAAILARAVQLNGGIWAKALQLVTGPNEIAAGSLSATGGVQVQPLLGAGTAPSYALDVSNLGGMYAGKIQLIGTEAGLGVRNAGQLIATSGPLTLSNDGWLGNSGRFQSATQMQLQTSQSLSNSGTAYAKEQLQAISGDDVSNQGLILAQGDLSLSARGRMSASDSSVISAGVQDNGQLGTLHNLSVVAGGTAQVAGQLQAPQTLSLQASAVDLSRATVVARQAQVQASSGDLIADASQIAVAQRLAMSTPQTLHTNAARVHAQQLDLQAKTWRNVQGRMEQTGSADLSIDLSGGVFDNTGGALIANASHLSLNAGTLNNTGGQIGHAGSGALQVSAASVDNSQGQIVGNGSATVASTGTVINADGLISSVGNLSLSGAELINSASGQATGTVGIQSQQGSVSMSAGAVSNSAAVYAAQDLRTLAQRLDNSASLYAGGVQTLTVQQALNNSGTLAAAQDLGITAARVASNSTGVLAAGMATDGKLSGSGALLVTAADAVQSLGQTLATGPVTISGAGVDLTGGRVASTGSDVSLSAASGDILTRGAQVSAAGQLNITTRTQASQTLDNRQGQLGAQQISLTVGHLNNSQGRIEHAGAGVLSVSAASVDNSQGRIIGNGSVTLVSAGAVVNADGLVSSTGDLNLSSADLSNTASGQVLSTVGIQSQEGSVTLRTEALSNSASVYAARELSTSATSLSNSASLYSVGAQTLMVSQALSNSGTIAAAKDLDIATASLASIRTGVLAAGMAADGKLSGIGSLQGRAVGTVESLGQALATSQLSLSGASVDLQGGTVGSTTGDILISANSGGIRTQDAQVSSPGLLSITAPNSQTLDNIRGQLSGRTVSVAVGQLTNTAGRIVQSGTDVQTATIQASNSLDNKAGTIVAHARDFSLSAGALNNTGGQIGHAGSGALQVSAASVDNSLGQIVGNGSATVASTGTVTNADGLISSAGKLSLSSAELINSASGQATGAVGIQSQQGSISVSAGAVSNSAAVYAAQDLRTSAQRLDNSASLYAAGVQTLTVQQALNNSGTLAAGQDLSITAARVGSTSAGVLAAGMAADGKLSGSGALRVSAADAVQSLGQTLATGPVTISGAGVDLTGGRVASTGSDVSLSAASGDILTRGAQVSAAGQLNITTRTQGTQTLDNTRGQLSGQDLSIAVAQIDNSLGSIQQSGVGDRRARIETQGALSNRQGSMVANSKDVTVQVGGALDNTGGQLAHAGPGEFAVSAATLDNSQGRILGNGQLGVASAGAVVNADGLISSVGHLSVSSADLSNTASGQSRGALGIQSQTGNVTLSAQTLSNSAPVYAAQDLTLAAQAMGNSASLYAVGTQSVRLGGALSNSGTIAAAKDLTVNAASLAGASTSVLAAGMAADRTFGDTGALSITTQGVLQSAGQVLATGRVSLVGSELDLRGATSGGGQVTGVVGSLRGDVDLQALSGNVQTRHAQVMAPSQLQISATGSPEQLLDNAGGQISGGQLRIQVGQIDNTQGLMAQTGLGTQTAQVQSSGTINNSAGRILANADDFTLHTDAALNNTGGLVQHAGNGVLSLRASQVDNTAGVLLGHKDIALAVTEGLNNTDGQLVAQRHLGLSSTGTALLNNLRGLMQTSEGQLNVQVGSLVNAQGTMYAGSDLQAQVGQALTHSGAMVAQGNLSIQSGSLHSSASGLIAAGVQPSGTLGRSGDLRITTQDDLVLAGQARAAASMALTGASADLSSSQVGARDISVTATAGGISTRSAKLVAQDSLSLNTGHASPQSLDNTAGALVGKSVAVQASGTFNNQQATLYARDQAQVQADTVLNTGGHIQAAGNLNLSARVLNNSAGALYAGQDGALVLGTLNNLSGVLSSVRDWQIKADDFSNNAQGQAYGVIQAGRDLVLQTSGDHTLTTPALAAGRHLNFSTTGLLTNSAVLEANGDLTLSAASVRNVGQLRAGQTLAITATQPSADITNTGDMVAGSLILQAPGSIRNTGVNAFMGAADVQGKLVLLAKNIVNADDVTTTNTLPSTTIYGVGEVVLAGGVDRSGAYTRADSIVNRSALIESGGDMTLAAQTITNTRRTLTMGSSFDQPVSAADLSALNLSLSGQVGQMNTPDPSVIGGVYIDPPHGGAWNSSYLYTTYTGTALQNAVQSISPAARILSGAQMGFNAGLLQNYWSQVGSAGNMTVQGLTLDQDSWRAAVKPQIQVAYTGEYVYRNYKGVIWSKSFCDSGCEAPGDKRNYTRTLYDSSLTANGSISGTGVTLNNGVSPVVVVGAGGVTAALSDMAHVAPSSLSASSQGAANSVPGATQATLPPTSALSSGSVDPAGAKAAITATDGRVVREVSAPGLPASPGDTALVAALASGAGRSMASATQTVKAPSVSLPDSSRAGAGAIGHTVAPGVSVSQPAPLNVPNNGLFKPSPNPDAQVLVETNPQFIQYKNWVGSDYMLQALNLDPAVTQKRLGDAYYEQKLIREQVAQLTGRQFLGDHSSTQDDYLALMASAVTVAKAFNLRPGIALTPEQVAQLTSDVVWLVSQEVTLPDGAKQTVLVPQVYLSQISRRNLQRDGALVAANTIDLTGLQGLSNGGTIQATQDLQLQGEGDLSSRGGSLSAGRQMTLRAGGNIDLASANLQAGSLTLGAGQALNLQTLTQTTASANGSRTRLERQTSVQVSGDAAIATGGDLNQLGVRVAVAGDLSAQVGGNWNLDSVQTQESKTASRMGGSASSTATQHTGSSLSVGGNTLARVAGDLSVSGSQLQLGSKSTDTAQLNVGGSVTLNAVTDRTDIQSSWNTGGGRFGASSQGSYARVDETVQGSSIQAGGQLQVQAGQDMELRASQVQAAGLLSLRAGGSVNAQAVQETHGISVQEAGRRTGLVNATAGQSASASQSSTAVGSQVEGQSVSIQAGQDLGLKGSNVLADRDLSLSAGGNVNIEAAQNTQSQSNYRQESKSGLMSNGGLSLSVGSRSQSLQQQSQQSTAAASTVGSLGGNVSITAGQSYTQTGSDVLSPGGNIDISAKTVNLTEARENLSQSSEQQFNQSGVTLAVTSNVASSLQAAGKQLQAAGNTSSSRLQALGAANAAMNLRQAAGALQAGQGNAEGMVATADPSPDGSPVMKPANAADQAGGISASLSVGTSSSQARQQSSADTARGSTVKAGGDIGINATGAGQDSKLTVVGSQIKAAGNTTLQADNQVLLQAAQNTTQDSSSQSASSASLGIGASLGNAGSSSGGSLGITLSASASRGQGQGSGTSYTNTEVEGGQQVRIQSGGDTTLKGATVTGAQVIAKVGGNLSIESLQDTSQYRDKSQSAGGSVTIGPASGGSLNLGQSKISSDFKSVGEQSAIRAGDGGFDVQVQGRTRLVGGQITSTQAAIDNNKNSYDAKQGTSTEDLQNSASYEAKSIAIGLGAGAQPGKSVSAGLSGVGFGSDSGSASSTTTAGISGVAGNTAARTGDASTSLKPIFDADKVSREINAQVSITQEFNKQAGKAISDFAASQRRILQYQIKTAVTPEEKAQAEKDIKDVNMQERALNILVSSLTGMAGAVVTKEALSTAAEKMRDLMIEDSRKFAGVVDSTGKVLSNVSGSSEGVRGDGVKLGGTRVDLDLLCGSGNERCKTNVDGGLDLNASKQVQFDSEKSGMAMSEFLKTPEGQKLPGVTGGIQGEKGTLFGIPYAAGSWQDKLIEAFAGSHDFIGGRVTGLYDGEGNIKRGMNTAEKIAHDRWAELAIPAAAPFAAAEELPPEIWKAIGILLGVAR